MAEVHMSSNGAVQTLTVPGYTIESEEFKIKFVGANQDGVKNYTMEYETDWEDVMSALMLCLETFPTDVERAELIAKSELETWAKEQEGGEKLNLSMDIKFCERLHPLTWVGGSKDVKVKFSDKSNTEANFIVVKKRIVRSLQDLAAEAIANTLKSFSSVSTFQLPIMLRMNVKKWYFNHWNSRFFDKKMYHYFKTKEVARRVNELIMVPKPKPSKSKSKPFAKKLPKVKRLQNISLNERCLRSGKEIPKKPKGHEKQTVNFGSLKECPVCEKKNLRNVRLHMARSKECKRTVRDYY